MTNNPEFWTDLATSSRPDSAPDSVPASEPHDDHEATTALAIASGVVLVNAPEEAAPLPSASGPANSGVSLHPRMRLALDELFSDERVQIHNLAILVGRIRRVPFRRPSKNDTRPGRIDQAKAPKAQAATDSASETPKTAPGRYAINDYGIREDAYRFEVQEVAGDEFDSAVMSYSLELAISHRLIESGLFVDGQRLALCGPLRMERSYDARFATSLTDPGRPDWTTKLEVVTMLPVDEATPDGSFVELIGVVEGEPRIRREMVGAGASEPFASVRLRCRRQLRSGIARSRAVFSTSTVLTLHVPLSGDLAQAGALLRDGNTVHVHGRLAQYRYQLPVRAPAQSAAHEQLPDRAPADAGARAERKGVGDVLEDIASAARARLAQRQPDADATAFEREIRRAQQRFLTVIKPTIEVGYVELQHGKALSDDEIGELIAHWRLPSASDQSTRRGAAAPAPAKQVTGELDTATAAAFPPPQFETAPLAALPGKPRRRPRAEEDAPAPETPVEPDIASNQETNDAT